MPTVLITGANRGLGLEFASQYIEDGWRVIAANRTPFTPDIRERLGEQVIEHPYDALDDTSADALAAALKGQPIDIAIFNAGTSKGQDLPPEALTTDQWHEVMLINAYAPLRLAALIEPNLRAGDRKVAAAISSLAASASAYQVPRQFTYRASKGALNQLWRTLSVEWEEWEAICLLLRPGRVKTRMTGFTGDLTPQDSVRGMKAVIDAATPQQSGLHLGYDGAAVPW